MSLALQSYYLDNIGITRWKLRLPYEKPQKNSVGPTPEIITENNLKSEPKTSLVTWKQHNDQAQTIFLAEPNETEQELLKAITQACAKQTPYSTGQLLAEINSAQDFITAFPLSCTHILIFGINQAKLMDPTFSKPGIYSLGSVKICVTYSLSELATQPECKRELWQAWKSII
jgi:hypothetical protein